MSASIAICLTSHNRVDCTRINQEIFKLNFTHPYILVHASSGSRAAPYLEDAFVSCKPLPHRAGAITNMQTAIRAALPFKTDYLVLIDGDTWLLDERVLMEWIRRLDENPALLMATSSWMPTPRMPRRLAIELVQIVRIRGDRARRLAAVPRRMAYDIMDFSTQLFILRNYVPLVEAFLSLQVDDYRSVERQWFDRFSARFSLGRVLRMTEREPVHPDNRFACERLGLYSQHWPAAGTSTDPADETDFLFVRPGTPGKREALESSPHIRKGESIQRLLSATSPEALAYYNAGAKRY